MKNLIIILLAVAFSFGVDNISTPTDYNTVSTGNRANLASNFSEIETKFNSSVDSLEQVRNLFSNYTTNLTLTSQSNMIMTLDEDNTETARFLIRGGAGDSLFYVSEDSTVKIWNTVTYDNLTATRLTSTDANKAIVSVSDLTSWIAGTANEVEVTDDGDGTLTLSLPNTLTITGAFTSATVNTGQGANELYDMDQNVQTTDAVVFTTINTGQGANELYDMDQNVQSTDAVTFTTVNTGQGANELYDMDQNVLTTSDVEFGSVAVNTSSPVAKLHVVRDTAGTIGPLGVEAELAIEDELGVSIQFRGSNSATNFLIFSSPDDSLDGLISYGNFSEVFFFKVGGTIALTLSEELLTANKLRADSITTNGTDYFDFFKGSFTATLTGVSGSVTGTSDYEVTDNTVTVCIPELLGTSNATTATITGVPSEIRSSRTNAYTSIWGRDNTTSQGITINTGSFSGGDSVWTLGLLTGGSFTASGTKGNFESCFSYLK